LSAFSSCFSTCSIFFFLSSVANAPDAEIDFFIGNISDILPAFIDVCVVRGLGVCDEDVLYMCFDLRQSAQKPNCLVNIFAEGFVSS